MSDIVRFSVSIEGDLLERFDAYCEQGQFATRSEAIRQLLRNVLNLESWQSGHKEAVATLTMVYDHHRTNLTDKLLELQHKHVDMVVSSMHVHLSHALCLEVIVLRGKAGPLQEMAAALGGLKGIHKAQLVLASSELHE